MDARARYRLPEGGPYLLSHSVGCLPIAAEARLKAGFLEPWATAGGDAWPTWLAAIDGFRTALAQLLHGEAADFCPQPSVSAGFAQVLTALPQDTDRRTILMHADAFPTMGFVAAALKRRGLTLELIDAALPADDPTVWADHLTADTLAALVTHVHSNTGVVSPVADIAAQCRAQGAYAFVDIAQSVGIMPIDLKAWQADAVFGSCVKWLCGGPGAGFLWLRPDLTATLAPEHVGWFSHKDPFEFDIRHFDYAADALRFWGGTPAVAPFAAAGGAIDAMLEIGVEEARAHNQRLQTRALGDAGTNRLAAGSLARTGGTLCLALGSQAEAFEERLKAEGCRFDRRGDTLRLSFHIYNDEADADLVAHCLKGL